MSVPSAEGRSGGDHWERVTVGIEKPRPCGQNVQALNTASLDAALLRRRPATQAHGGLSLRFGLISRR
jgi:hypothetical protein